MLQTEKDRWGHSCYLHNKTVFSKKGKKFTLFFLTIQIQHLEKYPFPLQRNITPQKPYITLTEARWNAFTVMQLGAEQALQGWCGTQLPYTVQPDPTATYPHESLFLRLGPTPSLWHWGCLGDLFQLCRDLRGSVWRCWHTPLILPKPFHPRLPKLLCEILSSPFQCHCWAFHCQR